MSRWANIGLDPDHHDKEYFLTRVDEPLQVPLGYVALPSGMVEFRLYRRSDVAAESNDSAAVPMADVGQSLHGTRR